MCMRLKIISVFLISHQLRWLRSQNLVYLFGDDQPRYFKVILTSVSKQIATSIKSFSNMTSYCCR